MVRKCAVMIVLLILMLSLPILSCDVQNLQNADGVIIQGTPDVTTTFQAENAVIVSGSVESENSGFTGSGYANTDNSFGNYIEFTIVATQSAPYDLIFTYALASGNRYASIQVNGSTEVSGIDFYETGAWTTWQSSSATVNLDAGGNTIRLVAEQAEGLANIDRMDVYGYAVTEGSSTPSTSSNTSTSNSNSSNVRPVSGDITLSPGDDLQAAVNSIGAGRTIWLNGGTYNLSATIMIAEGNDGTSSARKRIAAAGNGKPVLDWNWKGADNSSARGVILDAAYWHISGITFREAGDNGMLLSGDNNIIERCIFTANRDTGLQLSRYNSQYNEIREWPSNNLVVQCESYDNADTDGEDADGFAAKLTVGEGNIFRGCYAHNNIDDGWDLYTKSSTGPIGKVTIEYCISYKNGMLTNGKVNASGDRNGFKLGGENIPVDHTVRYCIAAENGKHGFTYNRNLGNIRFSNNTGYRNAQRNFSFDGGRSTFMNNISLNSGSNDKIIGSSLNPNYNAWWSNNRAVSGRGITVTASDFRSLSAGSITWVSDTSINLGNLLIPASGSDLIGTGSGGANMGAR